MFYLNDKGDELKVKQEQAKPGNVGYIDDGEAMIQYLCFFIKKWKELG